MIITRDNVTELRHGQTLYFRLETGSDRLPRRVRVTGKLKTWKTRPGDFRLPVKHGLYYSFYITEDNGHDFDTDQNAAFAAIGETNNVN